MTSMMKVLFICLTILLSLSSCITRTSIGPCIGIADQPDPHFIYKPSTWNIILGIVFIETIFVPVLVIFDEISCPVGTAIDKHI